jgi:hypothetical protein
MTKEEAIKILKECRESKLKYTFITLNEYQAATDMAIQALEKEPCEDAISRQAVIDAMFSLCGDGTLKENEWRDNPHIDSIIDAINDLPSVRVAEKVGRWEWVQYDFDPKIGNWHCSECRNILVHAVKKDDVGGIPIAKYCLNCGAKMVEPQESEVEE